MDVITPTPEQFLSFVELLERELPDHRDNRGKRHSLVFVVVAFVISTMRGGKNLSTIHRFICNNTDFLHRVTKIPKVRAISRAHLPRLLGGLDWSELDKLIKRSFGIHIVQESNGKVWVAVDGKALRGTPQGDEKRSTVLAVLHKTREVVGEVPQVGEKSSEIPVTRTMLRETELDKQKVTLDALHFNPITTAQIHQAGGVYLIQAKDNQPLLLKHCQTLATSQRCMAEVTETGKGNGRVTTRHAEIFSMASVDLDSRWVNSCLQTCVVMKRETFEVTTKKTTFDTSYYISNQPIDETAPETTVLELAHAVRNHWGVESNNWIRDVTFGEDKVKAKAGNQGQIMGRLRSLGIALIKKTSPKNFQASIEKFADSFTALESMLREVKFL